ncbi:hypothetical protein CH063_07156 [Colletotrichum higginsianum]|uniref:Uncharacterized protein n=1 Tax=Colletotrichum higginsianum (strain IMI 349063) TaxID=759273 RepID=H1V546_COLHI|nr:uncharacterized protein CH63R_09733 [Colletotrichum higginsianum IMI 349063]OBR05613.1 hypothetical protein CH63R_09733 [Colletotrichum higginsianum IMI 349063]CCF35348.1 hypothetical protein CH063_07156 [Colletotrichum higginsianum]
MPAIHQLAQAAQNSPLRFLATRNGSKDGDGDDDNSGLSGVAIAAIIVCVVVFITVLGCCYCCCCRRRRRKGNSSSSSDSDDDKDEGSGGGGGNKFVYDPTKYIKKAIKKALKKIKKMVSKKNKKNKEKKAAGTAVHLEQTGPYGQGTHPGYGQNECEMGYNGGYDRLDGENEERVALASSPYGARNEH